MTGTRYTRYITAACSYSMMDNANHLAVAIGLGGGDFYTFPRINYRDSSNNEYSVVAFPCPPEFFDVLVAEPQKRDFAPESWSKTKAEAAQAALLIYQGDGDIPQAQTGKIVIIADMEPLAAIAEMGLTRIAVGLE